MIQPLAGLVAAILLGPRLLAFSEDGVSYLGVSACSVLLALASLRLQLESPGRWSWAWLLASAAFAGTPLRLIGWPVVPVWPALLVLSRWLVPDVWRGYRAGGTMRLAAVLMVAPFAIGYGVGHLPIEGVVWWRGVQAAMCVSVAVAAALSMIHHGDPARCLQH